MRIALKNKSRRCWEFAVDGDLKIDKEGIKAENGLLRMPTDYYENVIKDKKTFETEEECWQWIQKYFEDKPMDFKANKKMEKLLYDVQSKALDITDEDWEKIKAFMTAPENFNKEDVRVYKSYLAHNFIDRDNDRFPRSVLEAFNKTIVGKSKLFGHSWGPPGEGRYFDSQLVKTTVDETLQMIGAHPRKAIRDQLQEMEGKDGGIFWLVPRFYMLKDDEALIRKIDAGIIADESIGFRAPKREKVEDDDGNVLYYEYRNTDQQEAEAMEGSFVWLGSQYGARTRKSADSEEDLLALEEIKALKDEHVATLNEPDKYVSFTKSTRTHNDKEYTIISGHTKSGKTEEQSYKYKKSIWSVSDAKTHCKDHEGTFEKAKTADEKSGKNTSPTKKDIKTGGSMKFRIESLDFEREIELDEDSVKVVEPVMEALEVEFQKTAEDLVNASEELETLTKTYGDTKKELEKHKPVAEKYVDYLINEIIKAECLLGLLPNDKDKIEGEKEFLKTINDVDKLVEKLETLQKALDKPNGSQTNTNNDDKNKQDKRELNLESDTSYQKID